MTAPWSNGIDLSKIRDAYLRGANRGLGLAAEHVLGEAVQLVPIEESTLQDSGKTSQDEDRLLAAVSFNTPYAVVQHEDMTFAHDAGRQAKYLEQPLNSERGKVSDIIATAIRDELGT